MPYKLPEDLDSVTDDVFSYMCNLAMEKCSKKSEKKKASCGGAAMRKRLLIKNFVAQMLAQERQRTYANSVYRKDEYDDCSSDNRPGRLALYSSDQPTASADAEMSQADGEDDDMEDEDEEESVDDEEEEDDEDGPAADDEDAEDEGGYEEDEKLGRRDPVRSLYEFSCPPTGSIMRIATVSGYSQPEDEDDDEEEDASETARAGPTIRSSISPTALPLAPAEMFLAPHSYAEMISYGCVEPAGPMSTVASMTDSLMYLSPCTSASVCSTSELMFCDSKTSAAIYSVSSIYDPSAGGLLAPYRGGAAALTTAALYSPSAGGTSPPSGVAPLDGAYAAATAISTTVCPMIHGAAGTEWDEFHTVPLNRDYMFEESICPPETYYSLYPTAYAPAGPLASGVGYGMMKPPEQKSMPCQDFTEFSCGTVAPLPTTVIEPLNIGEPLPENFLEESVGSKCDPNNNNNNDKDNGGREDASELCFWTSYDQQKPQSERPADDCGDATVAEPPHAVSPLHTLVTMVPPMLKLGNCRSEFAQKSAQMAASYRRCITDLDTNTVVEEEYGCHRLLADVNRKRPSSLYRLFGGALEPEENRNTVDAIDDASDGAAAGGASPRAFCSIFMLTTSSKRLRL